MACLKPTDPEMEPTPLTCLYCSSKDSGMKVLYIGILETNSVLFSQCPVEKTYCH
jgi:hypothetical protein